MNHCAIVILNYNGAEMLKRFLPGVVEHSTFDLWVIDNASQDESVAILEQEFPQISVIRLSQNFGYAGGYNQGLEQLKGDYQYYILLNSDVEVTSRWDQDLVQFLETNRQFASAQPKILSAKDKRLFDYAGAGGGFLDHLFYPYCRGRIWNEIEVDQGQYDDDLEVDWTSGACFVIKSDLFHQFQGFDEHFFAHMEEIDLCVRMRQEGFRMGYTGKVAVYHLGGATLDRSSPRKLELNIRNSLAMIYKNEIRSRFWWIFGQKAILEGLAALGYLLKGQRDSANAVWKGYTGFFKMRNEFLQRRAIKKAPFLGPSKYVFLDFFFRGKKKFSDL